MAEAAAKALADRIDFLLEAITLREIRGWPNDPIHNAAIIYEMHGWTFDRKDAAMIRDEARRKPRGSSHDQQ